MTTMQLPALGFNPQNALANFAPLNDAIDTYTQERSRKNALALQTRESDRQDQELSMRRQTTEQNLKTGALEYEAKMAQQSAGLAQMAQNERDPARKRAYMERIYASHPEYKANLAAHGVNPDDHDTVANFLIGEARGYQDPMERQKQEAQIGLLRAQTNAANQRGDESKVMEVNGRLVRVPARGPAEEVYNAGQDQSKAPQGYRFNPQGNLDPIPGGPGDKLTEGESKDALFAERMIRSERDLDGVIPTDEGGKFTAYNPTGWRQNYAPDKPALSNLYSANLVNSKEWQQYQRAARESLSAILRKDTGAAVTDEEFATYFPTYFPIPGDSAEVVNQKKSARHMVAQGMRGASSRAFNRMYPNYDSVTTPQAASSKQRAVNPQTGHTVEWNGSEWVDVR